jgi:hypothetical protein
VSLAPRRRLICLAVLSSPSKTQWLKCAPCRHNSERVVLTSWQPRIRPTRPDKEESHRRFSDCSAARHMIYPARRCPPRQGCNATGFGFPVAHQIKPAPTGQELFRAISNCAFAWQTVLAGRTLYTMNAIWINEWSVVLAPLQTLNDRSCTSVVIMVVDVDQRTYHHVNVRRERSHFHGGSTGAGY